MSELCDLDERNRLLGILAKNPNCTWAKNELKYLDCDDPNKGALLAGGCGRRGAAPEFSDMQYHGSVLD